MKIKFVKAIKGTGNKVHNLEKVINGNSSGEINSSKIFRKFLEIDKNFDEENDLLFLKNNEKLT